MSNDKVTIVIPVYNSEKFLIPTIESALNQSYQNLEIIVVDDGSVDNSLQILQKYKEKIKVLRQENQGIASAVISAIKNMNGRWLKWLSPDDILIHNAIEILVNEAKQLPENTILYSNWEKIDANNKKIRNFSESNFNALEIFDFNVRLLDGQQINVNTTLIPSSLFAQGCMLEQLSNPVLIDYHFFLKAGIIHKIRFYLIEKSLLQYRIHSEQLSHKNISNTLSFLSEVQNQVLSHVNTSTKKHYLNALQDYKKEKPLAKKTMELGLKIIKDSLPDWATDKILVFYLNKIRSSV